MEQTALKSSLSALSQKQVNNFTKNAGVGRGLMTGLEPLLSGKNIAMGALALGGAGIASAVADDIGDVIKQRYTSMNRPVWEAKGQAELLGDYMPMQQFIKGREALLSLGYEKPVDIAGRLAEDAIRGVGSSAAGGYKKYKSRAAFDKIKSSPQVKHLGEKKAKEIYNQMSALAPDIMQKSPYVAQSIMDSVIATGTTSLRPEIAEKLTKANRNVADNGGR